MEVNYKEILDDFDRLLPLYAYVESGASIDSNTHDSFEFIPSAPNDLPSKTRASRVQKILDISLRHNVLQTELYTRLMSVIDKKAVQMNLRSLTIGNYGFCKNCDRVRMPGPEISRIIGKSRSEPQSEILLDFSKMVWLNT
ncbi:MAG: hypothetical protein MK052_05870 [Alphaproteobacteria bacterium]|nr:hypothetical protein [Alphaproteobacteria bacterium]